MKKLQSLRKVLALLGFLGIILFLSQCKTKQQSKLQNGIWRAELQREDGKQVVFNFKLTDSANQKVIYITNADASLRVDSIKMKKDSIFIQMPFFGSHFNAKITQEGTLEGFWIKEYGSKKEKMPFSAVPNDSTRIPASAKANGNIDGTWATTFGTGENQRKAIGIFKQEDNRVTGTFLTPVGDYRYLQGVISGDTLKLSGFDGCHALFFTAQLDSSQKKLSNGLMYSINSDPRSWSASKRKYDSLPKAYAVKNIPQGSVKADFSLKDFRSGKEVSINDSTYNGKVVVIQILGSWCPNCMDETRYLAPYYNKNKDRGVELIGVAFERTADFQESKQALNSFFTHFDINYPVLYAGVSYSDPKLTEKVFPNLPVDIHVFPTTIFIDKEGFVRKVHSGFNGPATGKYYDQFKEEFNHIVDGLLAE